MTAFVVNCFCPSFPCDQAVPFNGARFGCPPLHGPRDCDEIAVNIYANYPTAIYTVTGTTANAAVINSVTFLREPFKILDSHNFSLDGRARIILFTSTLGITSPPIPQMPTLSVQANGINLPIENVGLLSGMNGSYIIVRLSQGLPAGHLSLTITRRGVTSGVTILSVVP